MLVYSSDAPPSRKGWDAFDRSVQWDLGAIGHPASFDEIAALLPEGIHFPLILGALRTVADCHDGRWRIARPATVVDLPIPPLTVTTRKAA